MFRHIVRIAIVASSLWVVWASLAAGGEPGHHCRHCQPSRAGRLWRAAFPYGIKTARPADPYANPYVDVRYWYPKYYGNLHYREFHRFGYPTGDYPIRGTAW